MTKKFNYSFETEPSCYSEQTDEDFSNVEDFEYEVDEEQLRSALTDLIFEDYFANIPGYNATAIKKNLNDFIFDNDLEKTLSDNFEDELQSYFEKDAFDSLK